MGINIGYFASLRASHPTRVGDVVDGKRVTQTCYTFDKTGEMTAVFYLEGEREARRCDNHEFIERRA